MRLSLLKFETFQTDKEIKRTKDRNVMKKKRTSTRAVKVPVPVNTQESKI